MSLQKKTTIILDTDPGIDDAVAIAAALFHESISLALITTVAGNVSVDKTTNNALKLLQFFGKAVPVARGAATPLVRQPEHAEHIHGHSGLDGYDFDAPTQRPIEPHAVIAMRDMLLNSAEKITLVPIGPLTNIALLFIQYPECKEKIERIVMMGGSATRGNHTPNAEFNIYADPEAAKHVFGSGVPIVMCGLDVTNHSTLTGEILAKLPSINNTGKMIHSLFNHYRGGGMATGLKMHDLCAIAYLAEPSMFDTKEAYVAVETQGELTAGTTCVDLFNRWNKQPNATVCTGINVDRFRQWFLETLDKAV
jgi:non-specific riboncleoside hydrolase